MGVRDVHLIRGGGHQMFVLKWGLYIFTDNSGRGTLERSMAMQNRGPSLFIILTPSLIAWSTAEYHAMITGMPEFQDPILEFSGSHPGNSKIHSWKKVVK